MRCLIMGLVILGLSAAEGRVAARSIERINLLENPSFEAGGDAPASWSTGSGGPFRIDSSVSRSGGSSLRWENDDPDRYKIATQRIPLVAGRSYELSAWIKTENVEGVRESGATIALGYGGPDGEHITGGPHPGGQKGTGDWWQLVSYTGPIPEKVAYGTFTCYVRKHGPSGKTFTGTAWWDDVVLRPVSMKVQMLEPTYKNRVTDQASQLALKITAWPEDFRLQARDVRIRVRLTGEGGEGGEDGDAPVAFEETVPLETDPDNRSMVFSADLRDLATGPYGVQIDMLHAPTGEVLWQTQREVYRVNEPVSALRVHVDEHHRLIVEGEPFFPIGLYVRQAPIDLLAGTPFNCFMSYDRLSASQMDAAHEAGLKVIYSVKDYFTKIWYSPPEVRSVHDEVPEIRKRIEAFRDHPALLAWYVNDELGPEVLVQHRAHYKLFNEEDPHHPAWSLHDKTYQMADLMDTADILGIDSYPVPTEPLSKVAADTLATQQGVERKRPVFTVPQIFSWSVYGRVGRPPTLNEMRNMAWQAICNDARGLIFYSLHDVQKDKENSFEARWQDITTMAGEVAEYSDVILSTQDTPAVRVAEHDWLHWTARRVGDKLYLFALSDASGGGDVRFEVEHPVHGVTVRRLTSDTGDEQPVGTGPTWGGTLASGDVNIYTVTLREP